MNWYLVYIGLYCNCVLIKCKPQLPSQLVHLLISVKVCYSNTYTSGKQSQFKLEPYLVEHWQMLLKCLNLKQLVSVFIFTRRPFLKKIFPANIQCTYSNKRSALYGITAGACTWTTYDENEKISTGAVLLQVHHPAATVGRTFKKRLSAVAMKIGSWLQ